MTTTDNRTKRTTAANILSSIGLLAIMVAAALPLRQIHNACGQRAAALAPTDAYGDMDSHNLRGGGCFHVPPRQRLDSIHPCGGSAHALYFNHDPKAESYQRLSHQLKIIVK